MLQQALQPGELAMETVAVSPFEDIDAVVAEYEPRVFRFLLFAVKDRDVALELTQDTFLNAWRYRAGFRGECSVATWLMRLAVSLLRSHTRSEKFKFWKKASQSAVDAAEVQTALRHRDSSAEERMSARQQMAQVWDAVETLPQRQKTAFLLRFVEEMELPEIAAAMQLPLPTAKSHLYRALDKVRKQAGGLR
ncbi:MAG: sigma-70 family RNA polymerase sigma factor [Acidobacteriota bacterium]